MTSVIVSHEGPSETLFDEGPAGGHLPPPRHRNENLRSPLHNPRTQLPSATHGYF